MGRRCGPLNIAFPPSFAIYTPKALAIQLSEPTAGIPSEGIPYIRQSFVERLLISAYSGAGAEGRPGLILFVQTFGDLLTFNPHIHVLAADGVFRADGVFVALPV